MRRKTTAEFIAEAQKIHVNEDGSPRYDYSQVEYINTHTKIKIVCNVHGSFKQEPHHHIGRQTQGCPKCGIKKQIKSSTKSFNQFLIQAKQVHTNKYQYDKNTYKNSWTKIKILCKKHKWFWQFPADHLDGHGCPKCGKTKRLSTKEFLQKAYNIHKDKNGEPIYNYDKVQYINNRIKVKIICLKHGLFLQKPNTHLSGNGCPKCTESKGETAVRTFLEKNNIKFVQEYRFKHTSISRRRFDFYLLKYQKIIEFNGIQHYIPRDYRTKSLGEKKHLKINLHSDYIKFQYLKQNNIPLLVIPYWDQDRIPEYIDNFLANKETTPSELPKIVKEYAKMRLEIMNEYTKH